MPPTCRHDHPTGPLLVLLLLLAAVAHQALQPRSFTAHSHRLTYNCPLPVLMLLLLQLTVTGLAPRHLPYALIDPNGLFSRNSFCWCY